MSILFSFIIPPLIHSLKDVIKTPVPAPKKTFQCTFQMIVDGEVVNLKKSKLSCSPAKPKNQRVSNLKIDGELGSYLVSITINPSKIKTVEFTPKSLSTPEPENCDLGYTRVCLPNSSGNCGEGMYKYCPRIEDAYHNVSQIGPVCNCLIGYLVGQAVSSGVNPLGCGKGCVCICKDFRDFEPPGKGILISGGDDASTGTSVEVFNPRTNKSCEVKPLPDRRSRHTMDGLTVCGGDNGGPPTTEIRSTCITFSSDQWRTSHHLVQPRYGHVSWVTDQGIMLLFPNGVSETVIQGENKTEPGFTLLHDLNFACAIKDQTSNSVVITGGDYLFKSKNTVSRYGLTGFIEDMPSMNVERKWHGCGSYFRKDGTQVLLVAGGTEAYDHLEGHTSTELLIGSSSDWVFSKPLPRPHFLMGSVTMDGVVYFTGGMENFLYDNIYDEILAWIDEAWVEVGKMKIARTGHAATFIQIDDGLMQHCT